MEVTLRKESIDTVMRGKELTRKIKKKAKYINIGLAVESGNRKKNNKNNK